MRTAVSSREDTGTGLVSTPSSRLRARIHGLRVTRDSRSHAGSVLLKHLTLSHTSVSGLCARAIESVARVMALSLILSVASAGGWNARPPGSSVDNPARLPTPVSRNGPQGGTRYAQGSEREVERRRRRAVSFPLVIRGGCGTPRSRSAGRYAAGFL